MSLKNHRNRKLYVIILLLVLSLNIFMLYIHTNQSSNATKKQEKILLLNQDTLTEEWFTESHTEEWLENTDFKKDKDWDSEIDGDESDVDAEISDGHANYIIEGEEETFQVFLGTPNSSSSPNWYEFNDSFYILPNIDHEINELGCNVSHEYDEGVDQSQNRPSVHWRKNIIMPVDMSEYIITSVSLSAIVNGSGDTNLETPNDPISGIYYDYARFYVAVSDLDYDNIDEIAIYQTIDLGDGDDQGLTYGTIDYLYDTAMTPKEESEIIFRLNNAFEKNSRKFGVTLGITVYTEDNYDFADRDTFYSLLIKSVSLSITYEKKIDQETSVSWIQVGDKIDGENVEITSANLNFDYKINEEWDEVLSPNSEIRIIINDDEHTETIKLSDAETSFEEAEKDGFDVTNLIPKNKKITLEIQVFIADEFGLDEEITISIDDISLIISYDILMTSEQSLLFLILFIIACIGGACIAVYIVYYQKVLKYPKPVRKIRKYRKTLKKSKAPDIHIVSRENAFNTLYSKELRSPISLLKLTPLEQIEHKPVGKAKGKLMDKTTDKKQKNNHINKKILFFIVVLTAGLFLNMFVLFFNSNQKNTVMERQEKTLLLNQDALAEQWGKESYTEEWLENTGFDKDKDWDSDIDGDSSDVDAEISDGSANYIIEGDEGTFHAFSGTPNSSSSPNWYEVNSPDRPLPNVAHEINEFGCNISHNFDEEGVGQLQNLPGVQWKKDITIPVDMEDYIITSVSLSAIVNGTVDRNVETPKDNLTDNNPVYSSLFDFARFYVKFSDLENKSSYEVAYNQTVDLGFGDSPGNDNPNAGKNSMTDTPMKVVEDDVLIYSLTRVLENDYRHLTVTLGIDIDCEDNYWNYDLDTWDTLLIKSCDLSFSYIKKIDESTSISWEQVGDKISGKNVKVINATLNFDYKIDEEWDEDLSPNSEIRIFINDKEHSETIKLEDRNGKFEEAKEDGFDVTDLIRKNKKITLTIQVFIADEFELEKDITISIDDVSLVISYDVLTPMPTLLFLILFIIACVGSICLIGYYIYYRRVLRYPKPVRKVRKYRRSLKKREAPDIRIVSRESAFSKQFETELGSTASFVKQKLPIQIEKKDKFVEKIDK